MDNNKKSQIDLLSLSVPSSKSHCGYCDSNIGYPTWGFTSSNMAAQDYENLMFLNWRRCGTYYYKPDHSKSCCKLHAIRLDVEKYVMNKNQKKAMKKFNKYLAGDAKRAE